MSATSYGAGVVPLPSEKAMSAPEIEVSAVSWPAIFAGAFASIAATLILLVLGTGIGLSMVSPWYGAGASAATVGVTAVIWLVIVQWVSSGLGGYLAGRLRTTWVGVHTHEVFFRDTAHGFLVWALASVAGAMMFASLSATGGNGVASGVASIAQDNRSGSAASVGYYADGLFRSSNFTPDRSLYATETAHILANDMAGGTIVLSPEDRSYLAQMVAARTGISQGEAQTRVDTVVTQLNNVAQDAREKADLARKRAAQISVVAALAMLIGAFIASASAALGGGIRDEY